MMASKSPWDDVLGGSKKSSGTSGSGKSSSSPWDAVLGGGDSTEQAASGGSSHSLLGKLKDIGSDVIGSAPVRTALEVADLPRAAVVSALKEASDLTASEHAKGEGFSLGDLVGQARDHIGFGDIAGDATDNEWVNRALGFAGDVALDPLTYVTFGATAADGAHLSFREVADRAARGLEEGGMDAANRVHKLRSALGLTEEEAAQLGINRTSTIGIGKNRVPLPGGEQLAELRTRLVNPAINKVADTRLARAAAKATDPVAEAMVELRRSNPALAREVERATRLKRGEGEGLSNKALTELQRLFKDHRNVDRDEIRALLDDGGTALRSTASADGGAAADALREWFDKTADAAEELVDGRRIIPRREDYLPRRLTEEFREAMDEKGVRLGAERRGGREAFEQQRMTRAGEKWFGEVLDGSRGFPAGSIDEMEAIAKEKLGHDYVRIFRDNPWEIAKAYASEIKRWVEKYGLEGELEKRGFIKQLDKDGLDRAARRESQNLKTAAKERRKGFKHGRRLAAAEAEIDKLVGNVAAEGGVVDPALVEKLKALAGDARSRADQATNAGADLQDEALDLQDVLASLGDEAPAVPAAAKAAPVAPVADGAPIVDPEFDRLYKIPNEKAMKDSEIAQAIREAEEDGATELHVDMKKSGGGSTTRPTADRFREEQAARASGEAYWYRPEQADLPTAAPTAPAEAAVADAPHAPVKGADKIKREIKTLHEERTTLEAERRSITDRVAKGNRASDASTAEMRRVLDYTSADFKPQKAAEALRATGDDDLAEFADIIEDALQDETITRKQRIVEARDAAKDARVKWVEKTKAAEAAMQSEAERQHRNVLSVEGVGGRIESDAATIKRVREIDARVAKIEEMIGARHDKLNAANDIVPETAATAEAAPAPTVPTKAADVKVTKAKKAAEAAQRKFDQATAAAEGWQREVADTQARLAEIEQEMVKASQRQKVWLDTEATYLKRADELASAASSQPNKNLAEIARLESVASRERASMVKNRQAAATADRLARQSNVPERMAEYERMVQDGLTKSLQTDPTRWADPDVAKVIAEVQEHFTGQKVHAFVRYYDNALSRWKAYSLLSPGFHIRNYMGGVFNNWLAGVSPSTRLRVIKAWHVYKRGGERGLEELRAVDPEVAEIFEHGQRLAVWGGHDLRDLADIGGGAGSREGLLARGSRRLGVGDGSFVDKVDPTSLDNIAHQINLTAGERVERMLRSELFVDRMLKGDDAQTALDMVVKYHFDYSELSHFEQTVAKRVIPFYTWTRKNFPLQVENYLAQPAKYTRYLSFQRNLALGVERPDVEPEYYNRLMAGITPFGDGNDGQRYLTLDLPFIDMGEVANGQAVTGGLTPAIKTPIEIWANKSFFTGNPLEYKGEKPTKLPAAFAPLAPILEQLDGTFGAPKVSRDEDGHYVMGRADAYKVEQTLPLLGRLRRLFPNEKRYQDRAATTYLSMLLGLGSRTLTSGEIEAELSRRAADK